MKIFASSDHHFGHENIIKYCNRPVQNAMEDAKRMIEGHNSVVGDDDLCVFVGDIQASYQGRLWIPSCIKRMKGQKILVRGNHDHLTDQEYLDMGFQSVHSILKFGDWVFCHYPDNPKAIHLAQQHNLKFVCGHTHKPFKDYGDGVERINAQIDVNGVVPYFLGQKSLILG